MRTVFYSLLIILINSYSTYSQVFNNDPYKIEGFIYLNIEFSKQEILNNNIKSVSAIRYKLGKNGEVVGKGEIMYSLTFYRNGNPLNYKSNKIKISRGLFKSIGIGV